MKDIILILLGALITFLSTIFYRFIDSKKKTFEERNKLINELCYQLISIKQKMEVNQNKWVDYHYYHRSQKETPEKIFEDLMVNNKNDYDHSNEVLFDLLAKFELLCSEFNFQFPNKKWFIKKSDIILNTDLQISYDDYENVNSAKELKEIYKKYNKFINNRLENKINPPIDKLVRELRKHQVELKENLNFMIKYWA